MSFALLKELYGFAAAGTHVEAFDAVELSAPVVAIARQVFLPLMARSASCDGTSPYKPLRIIEGDGLALHSWSMFRQLGLATYTHTLVDIPPVYRRYGQVPTSFWASIGAWTSGAVVINAFCTAVHDSHGGRIEHDLLQAGWGAPHMSRVLDGDSGCNMIVTASEWRPWYWPSRWQRYLALRYRLQIHPVAFYVIWYVNGSLLILCLLALLWQIACSLVGSLRHFCYLSKRFGYSSLAPRLHRLGPLPLTGRHLHARHRPLSTKRIDGVEDACEY